ncbi:hypothetical protein LTR62_005466 [Meristemomyces frigidus]|uniref:Autophagy protein n=1 Tax=Meristemomyces frigidus TaxID=1508187 RepID=A0AAN7YJA4_9PEZI|nr:hypothetical protein LTR62_005466 [Meristemomyces frigidus]
MSWLWGGGTNESTRPDAYSKLDPSLKDFLSKEGPFKSQDVPSPQQPQASPDAASNQYRSQLGWTSPPPPSTEAISPSPTTQVPSESLYPDGRYAHLWKSYRPRAEIEAAGKNDQDKLRDVIDAYNDRRSAIGAAAIENCVLEQMAERECWETGSYWEKMNMCRGRNRQFIKCYTMQARFLKALGYLSLDRTEEEDERIQMHADRLYHEMKAREEAMEDAKKAGLPEPLFEKPLITPASTTAALGADSAYARAREKAMAAGSGYNEGLKLSDYSPERQEQIKKQLQGLSKEEKELEMQIIAGERRAQIEVAERIQERFAVEREARKDRRERGRESVGDSIKRAWGWDREG